MDKKHYCRTCKGKRNQDILFVKEIEEMDEEVGLVSLEKYALIQCLGCGTISFYYYFTDPFLYFDNVGYDPKQYFEEEIYPHYIEGGEELKHLGYLPKQIYEIYYNTILAIKINALILAAGGLRGIIEAICNQLGIKGRNLSARIDSLHKNGHLSSNEAKRLHSIRFLGNDALHEIETPKKEQVLLLLSIVNHLLSNLFINDKILRNKVHTIVDNFEDLISLIESKIQREMVGKDLSLTQILGKSIRVIPKGLLSQLEKQLAVEAKKDKCDFLKFRDCKMNSV